MYSLKRNITASEDAARNMLAMDDDLHIGVRVVVEGVHSRPELNHRKGRVRSVDAYGGRCGVLVDGEPNAISLNRNVLQRLTTEAEFVDAVKSLAPESLNGLADEILAGIYHGGAWSPSTKRDCQHLHVDHLRLWATDEAVAAILADHERLHALVEKMNTVMLQLGMVCRKDLPVGPGSPVQVLICNCCNTPYDAGGCTHEGLPPKLKLMSIGNLSKVHEMVHSATLLMSLVANLLAWPGRVGQEDLLDLMMNDAKGNYGTLHALLGLVESCTAPLPKCAHLAVTLISLAVSRRPAVVLHLLEPAPTTKALWNYLEPVFNRIKVVPCMVEERYGVVQLLNCIPLLYYLGDWKESSIFLLIARLPQAICSLCINLLHLLTQEGGNPCDSPPDLELLPELWGAQVVTETCFGDAAAFMRARPCTFTMACLLEVQGRWQRRGVDVSGATVPCMPPPEIAARLSRREIANYQERCADTWAEYLPNISSLVTGEPRLAYLKPIASFLSAGKRPPEFGRTSFLGESMQSCMVCALRGCGCVTSLDGSALKSSNGRCGRLARYCCAEHQKVHWKQHKTFCQRTPKSAMDS